MQFRKIMAAFLTVLFLFGAAPTYAAGAFLNETASVSSNSDIVPFAEETGWIYRVYNGVLQQRLWSYTRGIWLTDWINC